MFVDFSVIIDGLLSARPVPLAIFQDSVALISAIIPEFAVLVSESKALIT